jgi:hypothetical protein
MKKNTPILLAILWFVLISFVAFLLSGCENRNRIEPGDKVVKCVIDSAWVKQPVAINELTPKYYYKTDCGEKFSTDRSDIYKIGDTITYIYKKVK